MCLRKIVPKHIVPTCLLFKSGLFYLPKGKLSTLPRVVRDTSIFTAGLVLAFGLQGLVPRVQHRSSSE